MHSMLNREVSGPTEEGYGMQAATLQEGIDRAGSPAALLWRPGAAAWTPPVIEPEYVGWQREQAASSDTVALSDLSHHMSDLFIKGPGATRLLERCSANDYQRFDVGRAKQFIAVTTEGYLVSDGILMRDGEDAYTLTGAPASQNWVRYHGLDDPEVSLASDPDSAHRGGADPVLFRFQVQGPNALALVDKVFGPLPATKFFHSVPVTLGGRHFRAFRHGMTGQPGYEFIGDYADGAYLKDALTSAGEEFGLIHVGGLAYSTNGIESGWVPTQLPGIYTAPDLAGYRKFLPLESYEGRRPLYGSYFSERIEDYYVTPYELGYERSISFDHEFIGRDALLQIRDAVRRQKVTLVLNQSDVRRTLGDEFGFLVTYGRYRVEQDSTLVGMTCQIGTLGQAPELIGLALVEPVCATPGTEVTVIWGEHPGPGATAGQAAFTSIRATVQPSPYNEFARTRYRAEVPA